VFLLRGVQPWRGLWSRWCTGHRAGNAPGLGRDSDLHASRVGPAPLTLIQRLNLVHGPTPIVTSKALNQLVGCELFVKRDDMTAGAEAGNKIRKLEYLLGEALALRSDVVITCGGTQSNHARATALVARQLGLRCVLVLRSESPEDQALTGNLLLSHLSGAEIRFITRAEYTNRATLLQAIAEELRANGEKPYVIPEGGSNGLGALGYVDCVEEMVKQAELGLVPKTVDTVVVACGSGGTAAGVALGIARFGFAKHADAFAVCDDKSYFETQIAKIVGEATRRRPDLGSPASLTIHDAYKGPKYGEMDAAQLDFLKQVAAATGFVFDPVYNGKALYGFAQLEDKPNTALFIHTGGLPGLLAQSAIFAPAPEPTVEPVQSGEEQPSVREEERG
jgi:D-cysteine desulfhydrase